MVRSRALEKRATHGHVQRRPFAGPAIQICRRVSVVGWWLGSSVGYSSGRALPVRLPGRRDPGARNVTTADRGDKPATEEGDAAVAIEFDGWAVMR